MAVKRVVLFVFWSVLSRLGLLAGLVAEMSSGDNITLYCSCPKTETKIIVWFREYSHANQSQLILPAARHPVFKPVPRYTPVWNSSSHSYDLLIRNVSESDLGHLYCVSLDIQELKGGEPSMTNICLSRPSNVSFPASHPSPTPSSPPPKPDCHQCWSQLASWCPVCSLLSALISSTCVYCHFHKAGTVVSDGRQLEDLSDHDARHSKNTKKDEDKDVCYAALEVRPKERRQRPKKKKAENPDDCTYSDVRAYQRE